METNSFIDQKTIKKWSEKFRDWHYYPDHVINKELEPEMNFQCVDCPFVFQIEGDPLWYMFYTGYEGIGYQTMLASSTDLVHWTKEGLVMGYGEEGRFDYGGVTFGGTLFHSYDIKAPRHLKKVDGQYIVLFGAYPIQGGYEPRPGAEGLARSGNGLQWYREEGITPILSINGASEWEKDCIYQPWLVEHENTYYNFYNAANGRYEQTGIAISKDLTSWERFSANPVLPNGKKGSFNEVFCSDGKVFFDEDHWVMFYFGVNIHEDIWRAHIMAAYSLDLIHWHKDEEPLYRAGGHPGGLDEEYAHKISLAYNPQNDTYYMFYAAVGQMGRGIGLLTSRKLDLP